MSKRGKRGIAARARLSGDGARVTVYWSGEGLGWDPLHLTLAELPALPHDRHVALLAAVLWHRPPESPEELCVATRWADAAGRAIAAARGQRHD